MNTRAFLGAFVAALLVLAMNLHSQNAPAKSPLDQVKALQGKNAGLIEKQQATLLKLEELEKQAEQIRFLTSRG